MLEYRIDVDGVKVTLVPRLSDNVFVTCISVFSCKDSAGFLIFGIPKLQP